MTPAREFLTTGGYLHPVRSWVLPLRDDPATEPPLELDLVFDGLARDERVMIRSLATPISPRIRRRGWAAVEALRAGRSSGRQQPAAESSGGSVGDALREFVTFGLTGQSYIPSSRGVTRERLAEAGAAETKVRGHLVVLQVHVLVRAPDRRCARQRLTAGRSGLRSLRRAVQLAEAAPAVASSYVHPNNRGGTRLARRLVHRERR